MSKLSQLKNQILLMPKFDGGLAEAWLGQQPVAQRWLFEHAVKRGWIRETGQGLYEPVPKKPLAGGTGGGTPLALTGAQVVDIVAGGKTKAADIIAECAARHTVSRRTVMARLASAVDTGLLVKTVPAGSYALAKIESID